MAKCRARRSWPSVKPGDGRAGPAGRLPARRAGAAVVACGGAGSRRGGPARVVAWWVGGPARGAAVVVRGGAGRDVAGWHGSWGGGGGEAGPVGRLYSGGDP